MAMKKGSRRSEKTIDQKIKNLQTQTVGAAIFAAILIVVVMLYTEAYFYDHKAEGVSFFQSIGGGLGMIFKDPLYFWPIPSGAFSTILVILVIAEGLIFFDYTLQKARIGHDRNTVKGSAKWGDPKAFTDEYAQPLGQEGHAGYDNYIYGQNTYLAKKPSHMSKEGEFLKGPSSLNTLIIGATGTGKTRFYLKPNLLQMNCSYAVTDPSGDLLRAMGETLYRFGYNVRSFDIKNMANCNQYNPLKYCTDEANIKTIVQAFMANTKEEGETGSSKDPFWDNAMNAFLCSIISLLMTYGDDPEIMDGQVYTPCFSTLCELTRMATAGMDPKYDAGGDNEDKDYLAYCKASVNEKKPTSLGHIFNNIRKTLKDGQEKPYCLKEWENYKLAPEKTATTILITTAVKLDPFNIDKVQALTSDDTVDLDTFGCQKDALFISTPTDQNGKPYLFLAAFMYSQLFSSLYHRGESEMEGSYSLRMKNGEQLRWFPRTMTREEVEERVSVLKNASIFPMKAKNNPEDVYFAIVDGEFDADKARNVGGRDKADIYRNFIKYVEKHSVTRRPTRELAEEFLRDLSNAVIKEHKGDGANPATEIPTTCRFLLDEFANIGEIPMFQEMLATVRKYNITCDVIVQSTSQLKKMYPDNWATIDANCPETVFLGGSEKDNNEYLSAKLGNETVITQSMNTDNMKLSEGHNVDQRALMSLDELGRMDASEEIVMISGYDPIMDEKYDYPKHPMYKYTKDYMNDQHKKGFYDYDFDRLPEIRKHKLTQSVITHSKRTIMISSLTEEAFSYCMGKSGRELDKALDESAMKGALGEIPGDLGSSPAGQIPVFS